MGQEERFKGEIRPDGTRTDPVREDFINASVALMGLEDLSTEKLDEIEAAVKAYHTKFGQGETYTRHLALIQQRRDKLAKQ